MFKMSVNYRSSRNAFVLLQYYKNEELEPSKRIYIVLLTKIYKHSEDEDWSLNNEYYYNSHTCPTNWMGGKVICLAEGSDADPHGLFKWVCTKTIEDAVKEHPKLFQEGIKDDRCNYTVDELYVDDSYQNQISLDIFEKELEELNKSNTLHHEHLT